ncbi:hypothetical protein P9A16_07050 [Shinella sp. 838]|uniref:hypothetical protein n=1 Tax=Shinella sp. 838 TaxID=3038164 RepID=UPI0024158B6C|nr:hypothetical protein [Shinella sp. 838]MDG4670874.1 hypothetical protein [Shinella sp. 838]
MTNPIDAFKAFVKTIENEEQSDFLMRVLWTDATEEEVKEVMDCTRSGDLWNLFDLKYAAYKDDPWKFAGSAIKLRAFTDYALDAYSEVKERETLELFAAMKERGAPDMERFEKNMIRRSAYFRSIMPEWESVKETTMSDAEISRHADRLRSTQMNDLQRKLNEPRRI